MGDDSSHHQKYNQNPPPPASSRVGMIRATTTSNSAGCGEIVEVQGGHIVRSIGRKDRHSKVCTAKGPRDRRVRLSAHTAIQFYDVQDRLGYNRPSKAVDWLIKKAKAAIDELAELPPWNPADTLTNATTNTRARRNTKNSPQEQQQQQQPINIQFGGGELEQQQQQQQMGEDPNGNENGSGFLPPSLDSDSIADTIKSFFPIGVSTEMIQTGYQQPPRPPDLLSRTSSSQNQDLRLSLQSFQEQPPPLMLHHHQDHHHQHHHTEHQVLFSNQLGFDVAAGAGGWEHQHQQPQHNHHHQHPVSERFSRLVAWNSNETGSSGGGGAGGFVFASPPPPQFQPLFGGQSQLFSSQRGTLQSSNSPLIRSWVDQQQQEDDHFQHHHHQYHYPPSTIHQSAIPGIGFASSSGGEFSGFRIPARIQGEEEVHDGIPTKPSSASSVSRH